MNEHPLQEYIDLIENNYIKVIYSEFHDQDLFTSSFDPNLFDDNEISWDNDQHCYIQRNILKAEIVRRYTFNDHIISILSHYSKNFRDKVRLNLLEFPEKGVEYGKQLQREIANLMRITAVNYKEYLQILLTNLKSLGLFLSNITGGTLINSSYEQQSVTKLKWLGKISTLATLFFDLSSDKNSLKTCLLKYDRALLADFIFNNFVDKNGTDFNQDTIYRYLNTNSSDEKKAKDRLEIRESLEATFADKKDDFVKAKNSNSVNGQVKTPKSFRDTEGYLL